MNIIIKKLNARLFENCTFVPRVNVLSMRMRVTGIYCVLNWPLKYAFQSGGVVYKYNASFESTFIQIRIVSK